MADFDKEEGLVQPQKEKGQEMKKLHDRIKKLKKEIDKGESEGLIIGRSKSQQEIDTRIDQLAAEFQKAECHGRFLN